MVVGNNHVHPHFLNLFRFREVSNATIDSNDQTNSLLAEFFHSWQTQAMTLINTVRDVRNSFSAKPGQPFDKGGCGCDAIDIKVAMDANLFSFTTVVLRQMKSNSFWPLTAGSKVIPFCFLIRHKQ